MSGTISKGSKLRIGFVGAGAISQYHLVGWSETPDAQVVAICDIDEARARAKAQAFNVATVYSDFRHLDVMRTLLGPLDVVSAQVAKVNKALTGEDVAVILMRGRDGMTVVLDGNISAPGYGPMPADRLEIMGTKATLIYDRDRLYLAGSDEPPVIFDLAKNYQACFTSAVREFVRGLRDGKPFAIDRLDNLETLKLMESCYVAAGVKV